VASREDQGLEAWFTELSASVKHASDLFDDLKGFEGSLNALGSSAKSLAASQQDAAFAQADAARNAAEGLQRLSDSALAAQAAEKKKTEAAAEQAKWYKDNTSNLKSAFTSFAPLNMAGRAAAGVGTAAAKAATGNPLGAVDALVGGFGALAGSMGAMAGVAELFVQAIDPAAAEFLGMALKEVTATVGQAFLPVVKVLTTYFRDFAAVIDPLMEALGPVLGKLFEAFATMLIPVIEILVEVFELLLPVINAIVDAIKWFADSVKKVIDWLRSLIGLSATHGFNSGTLAHTSHAVYGNASITGFAEVAKNLTTEAYRSGAGQLSVAEKSLAELEAINKNTAGLDTETAPQGEWSFNDHGTAANMLELDLRRAQRQREQAGNFGDY
jgi:phage-related protein